MLNYHESKNVAVNKQTCQTSTFAENPFADAGAKPEVFLDLLCIKMRLYVWKCARGDLTYRRS